MGIFTKLTEDENTLFLLSNWKQTFTDWVIIWNPWTEWTGINIWWVTYESTFKVSDINWTNYAQNILHRHSTTLEPLILWARSNSDTTSHANITASQNVFSIYWAGYAWSNYKLFWQVSIWADSTWTISNTSAPWRFEIKVTPDWSIIPITALTINNNWITSFVKWLKCLNWEPSSWFTIPQISFWYNWTDTYRHYIHTRHNASVGWNAIDFYTSDWISAWVYPTNAVHWMTIDWGSVMIWTSTYDASLKLNVNWWAKVWPLTLNRLVWLNDFNTTSNDPIITSSLNTWSVYPFLEAGNLVIQPRVSTWGWQRDIIFIAWDAWWASKILMNLNRNWWVSIWNPAWTPNTSSILDLQGTTKGFLPPRMTTAQKNAIATPASWLQLTDITLWYVPQWYNGTEYLDAFSAWIAISWLTMVTANCTLDAQHCRYKKIWKTVHLLVSLAFTVTSWSPTSITFAWFPVWSWAWNFNWAIDYNNWTHYLALCFNTWTTGQIYFQKQDASAITTWSVYWIFTFEVA